MTSKTHNPWPIAIIALFVVFIGFLVSYIVFATRQQVDLVGSDYYEQEIRFQNQLERIGRAQGLGSATEVSYDPLSRSILLKLPPAPPNWTSGRIQLYRPSDASLDQEIKLGLAADGTQKLNAAGLRPGLWKVRIQWTVHGQDYFLDRPVVLPRLKTS